MRIYVWELPRAGCSTPPPACMNVPVEPKSFPGEELCGLAWEPGAPHTASLTDSWGGPLWGGTMSPRTLGCLSQRNEVLNGDPLSNIFTKSCSGWGKRSFHYRGINWTSEVLTGPRQVSCQGHESWKDKIMHFPLQGEEKTCSPRSFISKLSTWQLSEFIKLSFNLN